MRIRSGSSGSRILGSYNYVMPFIASITGLTSEVSGAWSPRSSPGRSDLHPARGRHLRRPAGGSTSRNTTANDDAGPRGGIFLTMSLQASYRREGRAVGGGLGAATPRRRPGALIMVIRALFIALMLASWTAVSTASSAATRGHERRHARSVRTCSG